MMTRSQPFVLLSALAAALAVPAGDVIAQDHEIVVQGSIYQVEIERILDADRRTVNMNPRQVAEAMARIAKGRAPHDFWSSYQTHFEAWRLLALASGKVRSDPLEIQGAKDTVNSTFDDVEQIALRYRARLPEARR